MGDRKNDYISRAAVLEIIDPGHGDFHAGNYNAIAALPGIPAPGAELDIDATAENIARHLSAIENANGPTGRYHALTYKAAKDGARLALQCCPAPGAEPVAWEYTYVKFTHLEPCLIPKRGTGVFQMKDEFTERPLYAAPPSVAALQTELERLRQERRMIVSHATMGNCDGEGMSVNDVSVQITALRNELYNEGKAALADERAHAERLAEALRLLAPRGYVDAALKADALAAHEQRKGGGDAAL